MTAWTMAASPTCSLSGLAWRYLATAAQIARAQMLLERRAGSCSDRHEGCGQKINLHGLAADRCVPAPRGPGLRGRARHGRCRRDAPRAGKGSLDAVALDLCQPVVELFALHLQLARESRAGLAGFEPPDGRQLELLRESSSRQSNLLTVPWFIVPSLLVSLFGSIPDFPRLSARESRF